MGNFKGVYEMLENLNVPESPSWTMNLNIPSTSEMLSIMVNVVQNTQDITKNLVKFKRRFIVSSNCGEKEGTQTLESTEKALSKHENETVSLEEQVSKNMMAALNHLENLNSGEDKGLLDVEECIQDTHDMLMKNLLKSNKCGEFSTAIRVASDDGHIFPLFLTKEEAYDAVQEIVDKYNDTIEYIKKFVTDTIKQNSMYFRCAAWFLYNFVTLHPFSDGNGRMCRLLASHCLYLVFPFPCPVSLPDKRDEYLRAIKKARQHNGEDLGDLVALLIESGWHTATHVQCS